MSTFISIHNVEKVNIESSLNRRPDGEEYYVTTLYIDNTHQITLFSDKDLALTGDVRDEHKKRNI